MDGAVAKLTGQEEILLDILGLLDASAQQVLCIEGPSGCGKTELALEIAEHRRRVGDLVLLAPGDRLNSNRPLLPLSLAVSRFAAATEVVSARKALVSIADAVPVGGSALKDLLEYTVVRGQLEQRSRTPYLDDVERDILSRIQSGAAGRRVLLICDDFQWWDIPSVNLISVMIAAHASDTFPCLRQMAILMLSTSPCSARNHPVEEFLAERSARIFRLGLCPKEKFGELLSAFGLSDVPTEVESALYGVCGGHLHVMDRLREYSTEDIRSVVESSGTRGSDFVRTVLSRRLGTNSSTASLGTFLDCASIIGFDFSEHELTCLSQFGETDLRSVLSQAHALSLVRQNASNWQFAHELVRTFFLGRSASRPDLNARFEKCLRILSPSDYVRRADHLSRSGDQAAAAVALVLAMLSDVRRGRRRPSELSSDGLTQAIADYVGSISQALGAFAEGDYRNALECLDQVEAILPDCLLAERDILAARCHMKMLTLLDRERAVHLLENALVRSQEEPEIWCRAMLYKTVALAYLGRSDDARQVELELMRALQRRSSFDPDFERMVNHYRLKANLLHTSEVARRRIQSAIEFYGPDARGAVRDPVYYVIGCVNLSANRLCTGDFSGASAACAMAKEVLLGNPTFDYPRLDMLVNNLIIASFLLGKFGPDTAVQAMHTLRQSGVGNNDRPLLISNQAAYLCESGKYMEAIEIAGAAWAQLPQRESPDAYYVYYLANCLAGAHFMLGSRDQCKRFWDVAGTCIGEFEGQLQHYLSRRHELMSQVLLENGSCNWATYLMERNRPQVGPGWSFYSRGFLLSELEYWSDE